MYFNTKELASITICAALWGVLNSIFSPIFFSIFGLPILCDLIGFTVLVVAVPWIKKFGSITFIGLATTLINFIFNPGAIHFLGFTAASIVFDLLIQLVGHDRIFKNSLYLSAILVATSVFSAAVAGYIIGSLFMTSPALTKWGGVLGWAGLHALGGVMGGVLGVIIVLALTARKIILF